MHLNDQKSPSLCPPQGIEAQHLRGQSWQRHASLGSLIGIGSFLTAALFGGFGGQPHPRRNIQTHAVVVDTEFAEVLRNGEFFEMRTEIEPLRAIKDLRVGISSSYWRDMTVNTMVPAPADESFENGQFVFGYGPLDKGEKFQLKFDGQINPPMFAGTKGHITVFDGDRALANIPIQLQVFP